MNAFEKRLSLADVKAGVEFWYVFSVNGSSAHLDERSCTFTSEPEKTNIGYKLNWNRAESYVRYHFASDVNVRNPDNKRQYNFHALFGSLEDAQEYEAMINNGSMPYELALVRERLCEEDSFFNTMWGM